MKKILLFFGILIALLALIAQVVLPQILTSMLRNQVTRLTQSQEVNLTIDSSPRFLIAAGRVDDIHCSVANAKIGELETASIALDGDDIRVDMPAILFGIKNNQKLEVDKVLKSVGRAELNGTITEDNLKTFLMTKFSQIEDLQLTMTPEAINALAKIRILGRTADFDLDGTFIVDEGSLYFRAARFNVHNALLRHIQLDNIFADLKIVDSDQLPLNLKFTNVELQDGQAILTAVRESQ